MKECSNLEENQRKVITLENIMTVPVVLVLETTDLNILEERLDLKRGTNLNRDRDLSKMF